MTIPMTVAVDAVTIPIGISDNTIAFPVQSEVKIVASLFPDYSGDFEFVPGPEAQTIQLRGTVVHDNIVIDPIPQNYGLITWNGSTLTVS